MVDHTRDIEAKPTEKHLEHGSSSPTIGDSSASTTHKDVSDLAQAILQDHENEPPPTDAEILAVRWRIDIFMMPIMIAVYALQFLDKVGYGLGTSFGVLKDLQLSTVNAAGVSDLSRYRVGALLFWVGYILGVAPLSWVAQRYKPSRTAAAVVTAWGAIFICAPACTTYQGIYVQRFFLGFFEAGVTPCFLILTAMFYTKREQAFRTAIWWSGTGFSQLTGYPIMYGILAIDTSLAKWKVIYLLWGSITVVTGILFYFIIPNDQSDAYFLNSRQRYVAVERLRENQAGLENVHWKWSQCREALLDHRCWLIFILAFLSIIPNAAVSTFSPIVLSGLGYKGRETIKMTIPQGATCVVIVNLYGYLQQRWKNTRTFFYVLSILPIIVCSALLWKLPASNTSGKLAAITIFPTFTSAFITLASFTVTNFSGHSKRTTANAIFLIGYSIGQVVAPLTFPASSGPGFAPGFQATMACLVVSVGVMCLYCFSCWHENRRRDRMGAEASVDRAFNDLTDKENLTFRYVL